MSKLKTKSSIKKRFKFSKLGKIISTQANKQHNMRKRSKRQLRVQRYTTILTSVESKKIKLLAPYYL